LQRAHAVLVEAGVEVEEGGGVVEEVVVAGHVLHDGGAGVVGAGDGEVERDDGEGGEELFGGCGDAADVEEGGDGADGGGDRGGVREIAGVVLGAAADYY